MMTKKNKSSGAKLTLKNGKENLLKLKKNLLFSKMI
jgi:hypothetical protein